MPRQLRVEFLGAIYHVLSRGDRREDIFLDDVDWQDFPKTLAEASQKTGFEVHAYPWSSLVWYAAAREHRPPWLCVDRLLGEHGIGEDSTGGRAPFEERMEARRTAEEGEVAWAPIRRGWFLGSEGFRKEMLERMEGKLGEHHAGELKRETAEVRAERIITEELVRHGWTEAQLVQRRKGDPVKLAVAVRLRRETTLTMGWIAKRLKMGTRKNVATRLQEARHRSPLTPVGEDNVMV